MSTPFFLGIPFGCYLMLWLIWRIVRARRIGYRVALASMFYRWGAYWIGCAEAIRKA